MIRRILALSPAILTSLSLIGIATARAEDVKLPPTMAMTAYDTGTAGFNITVGVGKMLKEKYGTDLTARARQGKIDPVIGRDDEIRRIMQVLSRRSKNNPVLIGEPGVGKTAIAEGLARRIVAGDVLRVLPRLAEEGASFDLILIDPPYGRGLGVRSAASARTPGRATPIARMAAAPRWCAASGSMRENPCRKTCS